MKLSLLSLLLLIPALTTLNGYAVMKPETPVVLIDEEQGGGSINITNTDDSERLLYVKVIDLADDKKPALIASQPVTRVAGGQSQRVRFVLLNESPLKTEHIKRVTFEGISLAKPGEINAIETVIRQNLPVIIHPRGLKDNPHPWKALEAKRKNNTLSLSNPSAYVIRLADPVRLLPSGKAVSIGKTYILPGETIQLAVTNHEAVQSTRKIQFSAISKYGFDGGTRELAVVSGE